MKRRKFDLETKRKAVARRQNGESRKAIIEDLKIAGSVLDRWTREFGKEEKKAKPPRKKIHRKPDRKATAIVLLRHARDAAVLQITENPEMFDDPVYGLAMMALRALEGTNENYL
jgi:transposase-like protein